MIDAIKKVLFTHDEIVDACENVAKKLDEDYQGKTPLIVGILNGSIPFVAEMIKHLNIDCQLEFMQAKTYFGGTSSTGKIVVLSNNIKVVEGKDVIICDDIFDSGLTAKTLKEMMIHAGAKSVKNCCLLYKEASPKEKGAVLDYYGLKVENQFVVGFGLDYNEIYRNLPYIGILKEEYIK